MESLATIKPLHLTCLRGCWSCLCNFLEKVELVPPHQLYKDTLPLLETKYCNTFHEIWVNPINYCVKCARKRVCADPYFPVLSQGQIEILRGIGKFSKSLVHKENYEKCYIFWQVLQIMIWQVLLWQVLKIVIWQLVFKLGHLLCQERLGTSFEF